MCAKARGIGSPEKLYFTADPHFSHENIIRHCQRPFANSEEMDKALVANWNSVVPHNGIVYVLGDVFWKRNRMDYYQGLMQSLHGEKHLVLGNHDYFSEEEYLGLGFATVQDYLELKADGKFVVCCHYPLQSWNKAFHGSWHLHGHIHGKGIRSGNRILDVGVDVHDYFPVSWQKIKFEIEGSTTI